MNEKKHNELYYEHDEDCECFELKSSKATEQQEENSYKKESACTGESLIANTITSEMKMPETSGKNRESTRVLNVTSPSDEIPRTFPTQKYNTIVIDPPWNISMAGHMLYHTKKEELPYKTMTLDEIKKMPIGQIANVGCHVYCWTTNKMLRQTFEVLDSWGVNFHLCLVWTKNSGIAPCLGYVFATEFLLLGFYGKPMQKFNSMGKVNWLNLKQNSHGKHSTKPDEWYKLIEQMSPAPRIDLFARTKREGWDVWGDEV